MKLENHKIELREGTTNIERTVFDNYVLYKNKVENKDGYEYVMFRPLDCGCWAVVAEHSHGEEDKESVDAEMHIMMDRAIKRHQSTKCGIIK